MSQEAAVLRNQILNKIIKRNAAEKDPFYSLIKSRK